VRAAEQGTSVSRVVKEELLRYSSQPSLHEDRSTRLKNLFAKVDAAMIGKQPQPVEPAWRNRMYDERFDESKLGRRMRGEDV
jgi:hypothetical protein